MHVGVAELPATQLGSSPHRLDIGATGVDAVRDSAVELGIRRGEEARHGPRVTVAIGVEGGHGHRAQTTLGCSDNRVAAGRKALVGRQPVRQLIGQEGLPLLTAVKFPVGVEAVRAACGGSHRDSLTGECAHCVAHRHPVTDVGRRVERIEQHHGMRPAALEGDRDIAAHGGRGHHQILDAGGRSGRRRRAPPAECHHGGTQDPEQFQQTAHTHLISTHPGLLSDRTPKCSESHPPPAGSGIGVDAYLSRPVRIGGDSP